MKCFKCGQEVEVKEFAGHYHEKHRTVEDIEVKLRQLEAIAGEGMKGHPAGAGRSQGSAKPIAP